MLKTPRPMLTAALVAGLGLLWPLPLVGVLLMVTSSVGLAVLSEPELTPAVAVSPADNRI